jgi:hypothetical protein
MVNIEQSIILIFLLLEGALDKARGPELVVRQAHHPELGRRAEGGRIKRWG